MWDSILLFLDRPGAAPGAILVSAVSAGLFALITIRMNRANTRDRETVVLINQFMWDEDYIKAKNLFNALREGTGLESCYGKKDLDEKAVKQVLNNYELLSIGFKKGILSKKIYADYYRTRFVKDFEAASSYISKLREDEGNKKLFANFEKRAKKWA